MKWVTFTDAVPGVDVTVGHYQPRGLVSWTRAVDPYTFYVPQTTIAAEREPFEIAQSAMGRNRGVPCRLQPKGPVRAVLA